jgi:SmpA / OmlA family
MTNDEFPVTKEIQMTNDETFKASSHCISSFVLRHSCVIRHLSFVIITLLVLMLDSCIGKRITKANVDQVTEGMSKKQVESILGQPTSSQTEGPMIIRQTTYIYRQGKDTVTIIFRDDKVQKKDSTLSD